MRRSLLCAFAIAGFVLAGTACRSNGGLAAAVKRGQGMGADTAARATVKVENNGFLDADIFILPESGARFRLGTANGHSTTVLPIPPFAIPGLSTVRFLVDPIGGGRPTRSDQVTIEPGDEVTLVLPVS